MDIYVSVMDEDRHLTLDGDLDLLERLLVTLWPDRDKLRNAGLPPSTEQPPSQPENDKA